MPRVPKTKLRDILKHRDAGKAHYAAADRLLEEILPLVIVGADYLVRGELFAVVDNFEKHGQAVNKAWKPCGINRYDVKKRPGPPAV